MTSINSPPILPPRKRKFLSIQSGTRSANIVRFIVVVDEDVDPYNIMDVNWAIGTRCNPECDIDIIKEGWSEGIDPMITPEKRERKDFTTGKVLINACRPLWKRPEYPPVVAVSPELRSKITKKWETVLKQL